MARDCEDTESQRLALLVLANLAASEVNHSSMIQKGILGKQMVPLE
jgi:hypothetical protein